MRKINVYLQYPWKFPDSPYYKYLVQSPPNGVEYLNIEKQRGVITSKRFFWFSNFLKRNIRRITRLFNLSIPNYHLSPDGKYELIHCAHCLSKNSHKPWVADIEMLPSFTISGGNTKKGQNAVREILLRKNCKKIMPWTKYAEEEIIKVYPEIKNKLEVVYPATPEIKNIKKPKNKKIKIIFVARYFDIKGGLIALEVLARLRKKYDIEGIVVSNVPENLKRKYEGVRIYPLMPQKDLFNLMAESDLFLYPSAVDTFGFSLLEAMAFGLPILTINTKHTKSRREIVENEKTGIIFDVNEKISYDKIGKTEEEIIDKLVKNSEKLILDKKLREKMKGSCLEEIKKGKFSIKERNKKLKKIYEEAIK
jgi:glycosyltransferase involved in cell wall biosynthesis